MKKNLLRSLMVACALVSSALAQAVPQLQANLAAPTYAVPPTTGASGLTKTGGDKISDTLAATRALSNTATRAAPGGMVNTNLTNKDANDTNTATPHANLKVTADDGRRQRLRVRTALIQSSSPTWDRATSGAR